MIHLDVSRTAKQGHRSGLVRVTERLREALGDAARPVRWLAPGPGGANREPAPKAEDWWLTAELFCEAECPGLWAFLRSRPCRLAAVYHDAIPLKRPHTTWPRSVSRHAEYMKMLAEFDRVFAVSEASRRELLEFWSWQGVEPRAVVETVALGADFARTPRPVAPPSEPGEGLLCVGILEPRKNQGLLLEACERLWRRNRVFDLHLVGRVNPHFGRPVLDRVRGLQRTWRCVHDHGALTDAALAQLYGRVRATAFPTLAEGCGLPLLESLWQGVPCVCSDLPVLRENADGGGCVPVAPNDLEAWCGALDRVLGDAVYHKELVRQAVSRPLVSWSECARTLADRLG